MGHAAAFAGCRAPIIMQLACDPCGGPDAGSCLAAISIPSYGTNAYSGHAGLEVSWLSVTVTSCSGHSAAAMHSASGVPSNPAPAYDHMPCICALVHLRPGFGNATTDYTAPFGNTEAAIATRLQVGGGERDGRGPRGLCRPGNPTSRCCPYR